jgi:hypothetical protein
MPILILGIPLIKLLFGVGSICLGIVGIAQGADAIDGAVKEGKANRAKKQ